MHVNFPQNHLTFEGFIAWHVQYILSKIWLISPCFIALIYTHYFLLWPSGFASCKITEELYKKALLKFLFACRWAWVIWGECPKKHVNITFMVENVCLKFRMEFRADFRLAPGHWETSLQSNAVSHWLGANLESALELRERIGFACFRSLQRHHNEHDAISNHHYFDCLLNHFFRCRSKKTWSSASLAFVRGIHRKPVDSRYWWIPLTKGQ